MGGGEEKETLVPSSRCFLGYISASVAEEEEEEEDKRLRAHGAVFSATSALLWGQEAVGWWGRCGKMGKTREPRRTLGEGEGEESEETPEVLPIGLIASFTEEVGRRCRR